jgi:hypothetical protein
MLPQDFVCDFCGSTWREDRPMVEGHKGCLICARCLEAAYRRVVIENAGVTVPEHVACALCLLNKSGDYWQSSARVSVADGTVMIEPEPGACACRWCVERSAGLLEKEPDARWRRPVA